MAIHHKILKIKRRAKKTTLDCIPCFIRQALESVRLSVTDPARQERIIREALLTIAEMNMKEPPPVIAQQLHRRLREFSGVEDPYRAIKEQLNCMALVIYFRSFRSCGTGGTRPARNGYPVGHFR
jgi:hypothetical protein